MKQFIEMQRMLVPDVIDTLSRRYTILRHIMLAGIIGRRSLAVSLSLTERVLRGEVDFLKSQGLVIVEAGGIRISDDGRKLLEDIQPHISDLFDLSDLEEQIRRFFSLKMVVIVPGDSDRSPLVKKELGRAGAGMLRKVATPGDVIAVTGGSTMAEVAEQLTASSKFKGNWFIPARGGLGESVELQANTIASAMAKKTGSQYRLLHVPDHLGEEAYLSLIQEPHIREVLQVIRESRIAIHGIGDAMVMARRRKVDEETIRALLNDGALAEAFGYYFDRQGHVVHKMPTVGLRLEDIQQMETVIAVAGGKSKGEAIHSLLKFGHQDILVTDEAAALEVLSFTELR